MRAALTLLTLFLSLPAAAQTVRVKWERDTDFAKYQTYAWIDGTSESVADATNAMIVDYIDGQMSIHGIFKDELEPDLHISYHASSDESFEIGGGYRRDWTDSGAVTVDSHIAGTLVVDIVDVEENELVWRGTATATIQREPEENRKLAQEALRKMFASFPPSTRKR